jgi:hypothetical protein
MSGNHETSIILYKHNWATEGANSYMLFAPPPEVPMEVLLHLLQLIRELTTVSILGREVCLLA